MSKERFWVSFTENIAYSDFLKRLGKLCGGAYHKDACIKHNFQYSYYFAIKLTLNMLFPNITRLALVAMNSVNPSWKSLAG